MPLSFYHPSTAQFSRVSGYSAGIKFLLSNAILKIPHCRPMKLQLLICDDPESDERYNGQGVAFATHQAGGQMLQVTSSLVQQVHIVLWSYSYLSVRTGYKAHKQGAQTRLAVQVKAFKTYGALHPLLAQQCWGGGDPPRLQNNMLRRKGTAPTKGENRDAHAASHSWAASRRCLSGKATKLPLPPCS